MIRCDGIRKAIVTHRRLYAAPNTPVSTTTFGTAHTASMFPKAMPYSVGPQILFSASASD